jgi:hypothetical protein
MARARKMAKICLFSGQEADTDEHVIPDWLQRRFGLQRAKYQLPSNSGLDYRHAKVPARKKFNHDFGKIETRISQSRFVWEEVYLWLFKLHIGLMYLDTSLPADLRDPGSRPIVDQRIISGQVKIFRNLAQTYLNDGTLPTTDSPPGSVFVLPSLAAKYFDFQHSFTTGCIGVNIGDYYLAASLFDFGLAKQFEYFDWVWDKENFRRPPDGLSDEEIVAWYHHVQAVWLCNLGYWSFRWNVNMYRTSKSYQPDEPAFVPGLPMQRQEDPKELALICQTFGLSLVEFKPDGKSSFGMLPGRMGAAKLYSTGA